jgi:hypothetical protein
MGWKPLPDDVPLDHEALPPPAGGGRWRCFRDGLTPLPDDAKLDLPKEPPIIITGVRAPKPRH